MRAAEYGISIAKMLNAQIIVLYVIDDFVLEQITKDGEREVVERELRQDGQRNISYIQELAEKEGVRFTALVAKGRPFEQIVESAKKSNVDLIVMGTYGRRGAERILIGSVAERVIEFAHCPVIVVK